MSEESWEEAAAAFDAFFSRLRSFRCAFVSMASDSLEVLSSSEGVFEDSFALDFALDFAALLALFSNFLVLDRKSVV